MLRMITYGDLSNLLGMNTLLNSAASPGERCVSKNVAILNGTNQDKMLEFEAFNVGQSFPESRLVPVWPIKESQISIVCVPPYDSRTVDIHRERSEAPEQGSPVPQGFPYNRDSYIAGYDYTIEVAPDCDWIHWARGKKDEITYFSQYGYDYDDGIWIWADPLDAQADPRSAVVVVNATKNDDIYNTLDHPCDSVCPKSRLTIIQGGSTGDVIASYTNVNLLTVGFAGTSDPTNTYINTAVACESLPGSYFANGTKYGANIDPEYESIAFASGSQVQINILKAKLLVPGESGNVTFNIYGTWLGVGSNSDIIPVPFRKMSWSIDLTPNSDIASKRSITVNSCGNMNIGVQDIDMSDVLRKMEQRCFHIATVRYNKQTDTTTITKGSGGGIMPKFYPNTLSIGSTVVSNPFVWLGSGSDTSRIFDAIRVLNNTITVGVVSKNGANDVPYILTMGTGTAADRYVVNGTTITSGDQITVNGTFTIDLSNSDVYPANSSHIFRLRQYIESDILESGNASPEYADVTFTIVNQ